MGPHAWSRGETRDTNWGAILAHDHAAYGICAATPPLKRPIAYVGDLPSERIARLEQRADKLSRRARRAVIDGPLHIAGIAPVERDDFHAADKQGAGASRQRERDRKFADSPLEGTGFELVWGFSCQVVFFGLLPVRGSERQVAVLHPVACDQVPGARAMGSRDRNASKAWRRVPSGAGVWQRLDA
jgi:hypothetical protein